MSRAEPIYKPHLLGYRTVIARLPPVYFALVMATGIVAIAVDARGLNALALALGWFDVVCWVVLLLLHALRLFYFPKRALADLSSHTRGPGYFTWVAGTAVLGSQFVYTHDNAGPGFLLWGVAVVLWFVVTYAVFTAFVIKPRQTLIATSIHSGWLLAVVATQSIAVLAVQLSAVSGATANAGLNFVALVFWLGGGMLYIWLITLILYRLLFFALAPEEITPAFWITMGAMAISTLAGGLLVSHASSAPYLASLKPFLTGVTLLYWATATFWLPILVAIAVWRHFLRDVPFRYHSGNWGAVFPLGMYSVASYTLSDMIPLDFMVWLSDVFLAAALVVWSANIIGLGRRIWYYAAR